MKTQKLIAIFEENKYTGYLSVIFYIITNILLLSGLILSIAGEKYFNDIDTNLYWISEIMSSIRQIVFIGIPCIMISLYIERGE